MSWIIIKIRLWSAETQSSGTYSCVPKFVHDDCNAVSMMLSEDAPKENHHHPFRICVRGRDDPKMVRTLEA
jgi:hypothetical protein